MNWITAGWLILKLFIQENDLLDKIIIRDLQARGPIGISESERSRPQEILINAVLYTNTVKAGKSDSIDDCVNYSTVAKMILDLTENNRRKTVEAFAEDIADICLSFPNVEKTVIRVEKTSAVRFAKAAGVEIERSK